jgi:hypothetical protein
MKNYTVIGNCQAEPLSQFLNTNKNFTNIYKYIPLKAIFIMNEKELDNLYLNTLNTLDLIIIQPISDNYRDNYKYSTKSILENTKKECIKIIIPSLYFDFYHPYLIYINGKTKPFDYHDKNILEAYIENKKNNITNITQLITNITDKYSNIVSCNNESDDDYLNNLFYKNISNLIKRENNYYEYKFLENIHFIYSSQFITDKYKEQLLFYTMNHPTKYLFQYISTAILNILKIKIEEYPGNLDPLKSLIMPVYSTLQKKVYFQVNHYQNFQHYDMIFNNSNIIKQYVEEYENTDINKLILYIGN